MSIHANILQRLLNDAMPLAELEAALPVSLPTLRKAVQELSEARWIRVVGQAETNGGRPAKLFGLDSDFYLMVGVQLKLPGLRLIACDLSGQVVDEQAALVGQIPQADQVIQSISSYVDTLRERFAERQLLGIGMAAPGFIDPESGDILAISRVPEWQNVPICQHLSAEIELPVQIANDVDCMAVAEIQHTGITLDQNLAYVGFAEGLKISMFLGGQLYKGSLGNTGLVATDRLNLDPRFNRDVYRQIVTLSGAGRYLSQQVAALPADEQSAYAAIVAVESPWQRFQMIMEGAVQGLPICEEISEILNIALGAAVVNLVMVIQPDTLIIGGALSTMPSPLLSKLVLSIRQSLPPLFTNRLVIRQAKLSSTNSAPIGAVIHFLQDYLSHGDIELFRQAKNIQSVSDLH